MHPLFCATFGDAFLEGTGLEGGDLATSSSAYDIVLDRLLKELIALSEETHQQQESGAMGEIKASSAQRSGEASSLLRDFAFTHEDVQSLNYLAVIFQSTKTLCKKYELAKKNGMQQLVHYFKVLRKHVVGLKDGETLLVPGGIGEAVVLYIVEREAQDTYRFCVVNTNPNAGLDWHTCSPEEAPLLKYQTTLVVKDVTSAKISDDAFWGILLKLAILPAKENSPDKLYNLLLPFLVDKPFDQIASESETDPYVDLRYPQRSNTAYARCLLEASHYVLRRRGLSHLTCKQIMYAIEVQMIGFIKHDLGFCRTIGHNDRKVVYMGCAELARTGARLGETFELTLAQLDVVHTLVETVTSQAEMLPCEDGDASADQPIVSLEGRGDEEKPESSLLFPLFDRLRRPDDVNGLAGPPIVLPKYVPIDMLQIPIRVLTLDDAIASIRYCDRLCTLISVQTHCVKNRPLLKVSLIEHTFTAVLPCPKARTAADFGRCIWQTPMSYSIQLDICICLGRILEHFISSAFSLFNTKSLDALKITITACIAAMIDVTLRKVATDQPSEFCLHYLGQSAGGRGKGYGLSMAAFDTQSETIELHTPELSVARAAVLDYFSEQRSLTKIFNWQDGHHLDEHSAEFIATLCGDLAFPGDVKSIVGYITTGNQLINKNYPEFHILR
jgi:hypothetical protein